MTELYIVTIIFDKGIKDTITGIFSTEKKAIDFCLDKILKYECIRYHSYVTEKIDILSKFEYIDMQKQKPRNTIEDLEKICIEYDKHYKDNWNFSIVKKMVDNSD